MKNRFGTHRMPNFENIFRNKMKITIPNNNLQERQYILNILFTESLGLDFEIETDDAISDWIIEFDNSKLIFKDSFFNQHKEDLSYLQLENLPKKANYISNDFIIEGDIPVLYGNGELSVKDNEIYCGIDVFSSSFFMLTRWEEYVNKNRDSHNRFPATESVALKSNFLDRPIVNEYVEMLWNMLTHLGYSQQRKERKFQLYLTHDVDHIYFWRNWKQVFRIALGDIVKRKSLSLALERISEYYLIRRNKINDPYDTFDWLMDKSEAVGVKSQFYFMSGGVTQHDNNYRIDEPKSIELIERIKKRGHYIGFHPSYNAYNDVEQFRKEKTVLEKVSGVKIEQGREHYLRFEVPTTWQIWEDNGMKMDSTCSYADRAGFRCGTGDEFRVFNILTRKQLNLKERPLITMECTIIGASYQNLGTSKDALMRFEYFNNICNFYRSAFTILWHNSYFEMREYKMLYANILKLNKQEDKN